MAKMGPDEKKLFEKKDTVFPQNGSNAYVFQVFYPQNFRMVIRNLFAKTVISPLLFHSTTFKSSFLYDLKFSTKIVT